MITKNDIENLKEVFATKEDLKRFATKEDLKNYPTKDDLRTILQNYPTKLDLQIALDNYPTKADLKQALEENTKGIVEGIKTIIDMLAETADKTDKNDEELRTVRMVQGDNEKRICRLEQSCA